MKTYAVDISVRLSTTIYVDAPDHWNENDVRGAITEHHLQAMLEVQGTDIYDLHQDRLMVDRVDKINNVRGRHVMHDCATRKT